MHQNRSRHHHGTAEGSFTAKKWFGHRAGRSPCAHSIGKFFLCYFLLKLPPPARPGTTCINIHKQVHTVRYTLSIIFMNRLTESFTVSSLVKRPPSSNPPRPGSVTDSCAPLIALMASGLKKAWPMGSSSGCLPAVHGYSWNSSMTDIYHWKKGSKGHLYQSGHVKLRRYK